VADNLELDKAVKLYKATKTEYNKFIKALEGESWRNATYKDIDAGAIVRDKNNKDRIYIGLSNVPIRHEKELQVPLVSLYTINVSRKKPTDALKFVNTKHADIIPETFEVLTGTPKWQSLDEFVNPPEEPLFVYDPKTAKKPAAKKTTTTRRTTTKKPADDKPAPKKPAPKKPAPKKEPADKGVEEILEIARKDRQDKKSKQENIRLVAIEKTKNNLKEVCERELTRIGWGNEDAVEQCDKIDSLLESYTMSIITGRENFESVSKELVNKVIPDKIGKPKITAKKTRKEAKPAVTPRSKTATIEPPDGEKDYHKLLHSACVWIMGRLDMPLDAAYRICNISTDIIDEIAIRAETGEITLMEAVRELEKSIKKEVRASAKGEEPTYVAPPKRDRDLINNFIMNEYRAFYNIPRESELVGARGRVAKDALTALRARLTQAGKGLEVLRPGPNDPTTTVVMGSQICSIISNIGTPEEKMWRIDIGEARNEGYYEKEPGEENVRSKAKKKK